MNCSIIFWISSEISLHITEKTISQACPEHLSEGQIKFVQLQREILVKISGSFTSFLGFRRTEFDEVRRARNY